MFIGHFAIAFLIWKFYPQIPLPVILVAVSFPDLLWSILVPAGLERVKINPDSALQKSIVFEKYPYSHSLVLGSLLSLGPALLIAATFNNLLIIPIFVAGSASHWLLDTIVHLKDLPILGFDGDKKVGAGLWKRGPLAFIVEYIFYIIICTIALSGLSFAYALILGTLFHAINLPSFVGARKNMVKTSNGYASLALVGFAGFTILASILI